MSYHWSLITIFISIILFHLSYTYSTPINSGKLNHILDGSTEEYQRGHHTFLYSIKNILDEANPSERIRLLNQLREQLNRMCVIGYFGPTNAEACRRITDVIYQTHRPHDDDSSDKSIEPHEIQKRFFCNGFIGCKSASG